jgi:hypothetical protein
VDLAAKRGLLEVARIAGCRLPDEPVITPVRQFFRGRLLQLEAARVESMGSHLVFGQLSSLVLDQVRSRGLFRQLVMDGVKAAICRT